DAVQNAVNALFNGETPKPENTQEQIDQAKNQVNQLFDSATKEELLAKIQKAQQALVVGDKEKLTLNPYTLGDEYVTGTITGNIKKFKLIVGDKTYEPGFKLVNGKLEVYIGNRVPEGTKEFTLKAFNPAGEQVASKVVQVQDVSLTVNKYSFGDEYMTGSYTGRTTKKFRLTVDDKVYTPGFKLANGKFEVYIGNKITSSSKVVKLEALDERGKTLAQQNVTVEKPQLNMDEYIRGNEYMTGTIVGKGIKKFKLMINGKENIPGFKLNGNKFEIYIGNKIPANVNTVKVIGLDGSGKEVVSQDVTVQAPSLTVDEYIRGNEYMTGTFKGEIIKKFRLTVDGTVYTPGFKITDGNKFAVYIGNKITAISKTVTLEALDKSGNVLVSQQVPIV
ncbi:immunoglobulin-like domain-containing protein, partial [Enterococcus ratti]|uniref:immunoglobulin-like domain-containing protein n=1 Tax=Enterococcus ratti TaxID=150033 RepID=UPI0035178B83